MANTDKAFGFRPVGKSGSGYDGQGLTGYPIEADYNTSIYQGDCVTLSGGNVIIATAGPLLGVFMGCSYTDPTTGKPTWKNYYPANTDADDIVALVVDDPNAQFVVQCDGTAAATCRGRNAVINTSVSGSNTTGVSGQQIDAPVTGNATHPWKVVGVYEADGNDDVTAANADLIVVPNNHLFKGSTGTAGV
jgi:hypothetical protein